MKTREEAILQAVKDLKRGHFHATAVKVELEAQLDRGSDDSEYCDYCDSGQVDCGNCDEDGQVRCGTCDGDNNIACPDCERAGVVTDGLGEEVECDTCAGAGQLDCPNEYCESGYVECTVCEGRGWHECEECDGEGHVESSNDWGSIGYCHDWIMQRLSTLGLAEERSDSRYMDHGNHDTNWHPVRPLVYGEFYNDGSVDSEFTFTLMIDNEENVKLLPKIINIFNELADAIGNGINVRGAGMHMALINDPDGRYPTSNPDDDDTHTMAGNFQRSMKLLLPALYFLSSPSERSRALSYRRPQISAREKYSAIAWRNGSLEFRCFETCYDQPEQILDNLVVIRNCMRYWSPTYKSNGVEKKIKELAFGNDRGYTLDRLYMTAEHLDALNIGIQKIKPSYLKVREIKSQRGFKKTKRTITSQLRQLQKEATIEHKEYIQRMEFMKICITHEETARIMRRAAEGSMAPDIAVTTVELQAEERAQRWYRDNFQDLPTYIQAKCDNFINSNRGEYRLTA